MSTKCVQEVCLLCGRRLPHIFLLISKKKNCNASLLFTSLLMSLSFSFCTTSKLSRCHIYIYLPNKFLWITHVALWSFHSRTLQRRLLFCIRFIFVGFFYFEGHIIFYSFCFALTCENMSLILNSPSYFCLVKYVCKEGWIFFLYQTSEEIDRML